MIACADASEIVLTASEIDSLEAYEVALLTDIEMYRIEADSLRTELRIAEIEVEALKVNQRRWYDEVLLFGKVLGLALAAKWLNDG